jgi:pimeloyl-ACP methyl ester carboxylesterase
MRHCDVAFFRWSAVLIVLLPAIATAAEKPPRPREHFQNADVIYGWARDSAGHNLRTFITRPKRASSKVPAIFFVGWLSCDSVEYPRGETDGFGAIFWRLIEQSGYATVRMDKPGVGESQGDCAATDFGTELAGYQSAFEQMLKYDFIDSSRILVVGLSNGGGTSCLVAGNHPVRGYVALSSWGRTWYEHMLELERVRLSSAGTSPGDVNSGMKGFTEFYNLYLIKGQTPGQVLAAHPEWKSLWYDTADGQYGRPASFYQQLQGLNLGEAWGKVTAPVLVMRGTADTIMSDADARAIADNVNRVHPAMARYEEIAGADHALSVKGKLADDVVPTILRWMGEQLAK